MSSRTRARRWLPLAMTVALPLSVAPAASSVSAASELDRPDPAPAAVTAVVEFEPAAGLAGAAAASAGRQARTYARQLRDAHRDFVSRARSNGVELTTEADYTNVVNGIAVTTDRAGLAELRKLPAVAAVHADRTYRAALADAVPHVGAPRIWERLDGSGRQVTGTGQTVAVIDTGIDYHHPDLGGCFGRGCRVVDGYDFVNGDADPDDDAYHGTHVAGIIGASGEVTGVAPGVRFEAYKVLNANGQGSLVNILAALDAATDPFNFERPSVINMSLGGPMDGADDLLVRAVQNATDAGFTVVTAAGNDGPESETVGSPASAPGAITVGASTTGVDVPVARIVTPRSYDLKSTRLGFSANPPAETVRLDVVDVGAGNPADYENVDVEAKVVLVDSGDFPYSWFQDGIAAEEHGAAAALITVPDPPEPWGVAGQESSTASPGHDWQVGALASGDDGRLDSLVAMQIPAASAADVRRFLTQGETELEIRSIDATDTIPGFSARGPSGLMRAKPDLVAPGVEVRSTVPVGMFGAPYGRVSGTSMAAPMVAGAAALINQIHPRWSAARVKAALVGSARTLDGAPPLTQGAGLLDIPAAADSALLATPSSASFGLADLGSGRTAKSVTVQLTNPGDEAYRIVLSVREATGRLADVQVSPDTLRLVPGETAAVTATLTLDDPGSDLDVSGWITGVVDGGAAGTVTIPYSLPVRPLDVFATPDPAINGTEIFLRTPVDIAGAPTVRVEGPRHFQRTVTAVHDHGFWWRAKVDTGAVGVYRVVAEADADAAFGSVGLEGATTFEVVRQERKSQWAPVGPYGSGGETAVDSGGGDVLVASERTASLFRTGDAGESWQQLSNLPIAGGSGFGAQPVLAADPTRRGRYYLGIDAGFADPTYQGALFVTDDGGDSWQRLPYPDDRVFELEVAPDGRTLAVISDDAFYLSHDAGRTWRTLWGDWSYAQDVAFDGERMYLATSDGLYVYDGIHGELSGPTFVYNPNDFGGVEAVAAREGHLFVWGFGTGEPVYESTDAGVNWSAATETTRDFIVRRDLEIIGDDVWATSDESIWIGHDMGASWTTRETPEDGQVVGDLDSVGDDLWLSSSGGLYETSDEGASYRRNGVQGVDVHGLALSRGPDGRDRLVAATTWDTLASDLRPDGRPTGPDWGSTGFEGDYDATAYYVAAVPERPNVLYKVRQGFLGSFWVLRSDDGGTTWQRVLKAAQTPTSFLVHPADPDSLYVGFRYFDQGQGMFISHDGGESWRREPMPREPLALAGDPSDPSRVYVGDLQGFYVSDDSGRHFERLQDTPTTAIEVRPQNPDRIVLGGHRLYTSDDAGRTVAPASYQPLKLWVADLAFGPDSRVYAATSSFYDEGLLKGGRGVLVSDDGGRSYESMSPGLGTLDALSLAVGPGGRVYVGLRGGGVYFHQERH